MEIIKLVLLDQNFLGAFIQSVLLIVIGYVLYKIKVFSEKDKPAFNVLLSSGSVNNIKPELVLDAMSQIEKVSIDIDKICITRIDQYTKSDDKLISLDEVGRIIS